MGPVPTRKMKNVLLERNQSIQYVCEIHGFRETFSVFSIIVLHYIIIDKFVFKSYNASTILIFVTSQRMLKFYYDVEVEEWKN